MRIIIVFLFSFNLLYGQFSIDGKYINGSSSYLVDYTSSIPKTFLNSYLLHDSAKISVPNIDIDMSSPFSFETWVRFNDNNNNNFLLRREDGVNLITLGLFGNEFIFRATNGVNALEKKAATNENAGYITATIPTQTTMHVVLTYNGSYNASGLLVYINGYKMNEFGVITNTLVSPIDINSNIEIYGDGLQQGLFRFYKKSLDIGEIKELYGDGEPVDIEISGVIAEYDLNDDVLDNTVYMINNTYGNNAQTINTLGNERTLMYGYRANEFQQQLYTGNYNKGYNIGLNDLINIGSYHGNYQWAPFIEWRDYPSKVFNLSNKVYISYHYGGSHGYSFENAIMIYDRGNKTVFKNKGLGVENEGSTDGHEALSIVNYKDEIYTSQSIYHAGDVVIKKIDTLLNKITRLSEISPPGRFDYPQISYLQDTLYVFGRGWDSDIATGFYKSFDDGKTWEQGYKVTDTMPNQSLHGIMSHGDEMSIYTTRREYLTDNVYVVKDINYLRTKDGYNWYNVDSSYSQNVSISSIGIDTLHKYYNVALQTGMNNGYDILSWDYDSYNKPVFVAYDQISNDYKFYYHTDGWNEKIIPIPVSQADYQFFTAAASVQIVHKSDNNYDLFTTSIFNHEEAVFRYQTIDTFNNVTAPVKLSDSLIDHTYLLKSFDKDNNVSIVGNSYPVDSRIKGSMFFYNYNKTDSVTNIGSLPLPTNLNVEWVEDYAYITCDSINESSHIEIWESINGGQTSYLVDSTNDGVYSYINRTRQNNNMYFKIRVKSGSDYSPFTDWIIYKTPLSFKLNNQSSVTIDYLGCSSDSVWIDWGDDSINYYTGNNVTIIHSYDSLNTWHINIGGDLNSLITFYLYNNDSISGDLSRWVMPYDLVNLRLDRCSYYGDLSLVDSYKLNGVTLFDNEFTGIYKGELKYMSGISMQTANNVSSDKLDEWLIYAYEYFTNTKPIKDAIFNFSGVGNGIPNRTDLILLIENIYLNNGYTCNIITNL